jgi:4-amino-4-deoxy-L-arabinose transferase-like glycosyltransferase
MSRAAIQRVKYAAVLLLLVVSSAGILAPGNGASRPLNAHEIFVAQTATEMQERGDYLVPYYNGLIRLEKPPLPYWLAVLAHRAFDDAERTRVDELEARIPSLVAGLLLLIVTFQLGAVAFDDARVGLVAATVLATTSDFFIYSRSARPEMLYTLFCVLQMLGLMIAVRREERGLSTARGAALAWGATVAALLAKGPQHPAFFLIGTSLALVLRRPRLSPIRTLRLPLGVAFVAVAVLPYFAYLATQSTGALAFWAGQMVQDKPVALWLRPLRFFYPSAIVVGLAPWLVGIALALRDVWKRRHPSVVVLASCVVVTVVSLSFAGKLRHHYVLPAIPLCAVLAAAAAVDLFERVRVGEVSVRTLRTLGLAQAGFIGLALAAAAYLSLASHAVTGSPMWISAAPWLIAGATLAFTGGRMAAARPAAAFSAFIVALLAGWTAVSVSGIDSSPRWASATRFAAELAENTRAPDPLYLEAGVEESLVYYGRRRVVRNTARGWLDANPRGRVPLFVCRGECAGVAGHVIIVQRAVPRDEAMILVHPRRPRSAPAPGSEAASMGPATSRP